MALFESFLSAPPISRTIAACAFTFSVLLYTGLIPFRLFSLSSSSLIQLPPQLWRMVTSLIITGPFFGIFFHTYLLYVYGVKLEVSSPRFLHRADFVTYIFYICGVIVTLNVLITGGQALAAPLALAFITSSTWDSWDQPVTLIVVKMPSQYLPYAFLLLALIMGSPQSAYVQATGVVAAHFYDLQTGLYPNSGIKRNLVSTPKWLKKMIGTQSVVERPYGTVFVPGPAQSAWGLDMSWKRFGPGHTLGGEGSGAERQRPTGWVLAVIVMSGLVLVCLLLGYLFVLYGGQSTWFSGKNTGELLAKPTTAKLWQNVEGDQL